MKLKENDMVVVQALVNAVEHALEEFKPRECNCDGEYIDGDMVGYPCYFHRIEDELKRTLKLAQIKAP